MSYTQDWSDANIGLVRYADGHADFRENLDLMRQLTATSVASLNLTNRLAECSERPSLLIKRVKALAKKEPAVGKCDAVLFTAIPIPVEGHDQQWVKKAENAYKAFRLISVAKKRAAKPTGLPGTSVNVPQATTSTKIPSAQMVPIVASTDNKGEDEDEDEAGDEDEDENGEESSNKKGEKDEMNEMKDEAKDGAKDELELDPELQDIDLYCNPHTVPCSAPDSKAAVKSFKPSLPDPSISPASKILFPQLVVEYKRPEDLPTKALNQARMYSTASVQYLDAVGINGYPVFGLATHGSTGHVFLTWKSQNGVSLPKNPVWYLN